MKEFLEEYGGMVFVAVVMAVLIPCFGFLFFLIRGGDF